MRKKRVRVPGTYGQKAAQHIPTLEAAPMPPEVRPHRQVQIEHDGVRAEVDEGIAPLILALWKRGYRTLGSCQNQEGTPNLAWVGFPSNNEAESFAGISGGQIFEMDEQVRAEARAAGADAYDEHPDAHGVYFPQWVIPAVLAAVDGGGRVIWDAA